MKLHQAVLEGQGPVPVVMTLDEIIRDGKVTNSYQIFVLGWLAEYFKNGAKTTLNLEGPISQGSNATSTAVVSGLKSLTPQDQVTLATYLKDCVRVGESALASSQTSLLDWTKFVLGKQD